MAETRHRRWNPGCPPEYLSIRCFPSSGIPGCNRAVQVALLVFRLAEALEALAEVGRKASRVRAALNRLSC